MNDSIPALNQIIEPAPVKFVPEAPGWYVTGILLILLILVLLFFFVRDYRKNLYRKKAILWLEGKKRQLLNNQDYSGLVYTSNMLVKDICIRLHGKEETASLQGPDWIGFLDRTTRKKIFTDSDEQTIRLVYDMEKGIGKQQSIDFTENVKRWIKRHHST